MNNLKVLTFELLKSKYRKWLENSSKNYDFKTINTKCSDSFYIYREYGENVFWKIVESNDISKAKELILQSLIDKSAGDWETNVNGYLTHLRTFITFYNDSLKSKSMKDLFFEYIGGANSLAGYSRSYKLVFYKAFFENMDAQGRAGITPVVETFKKFYVDRKASGKVADVDVSDVISNIENSSNEQVLALIKTNPFKHISEKGFMHIGNFNHGEKFYVVPQLVQTMTEKDIDTIKRTVDKKIELYFSKIDVEKSTIANRVIMALKNIGGKGTYSQIYSEYETITNTALTATQKAGIRKAIESNSSDSEAFSGKDVFYSVEGKGNGVWGLRSDVDIRNCFKEILNRYATATTQQFASHPMGELIRRDAVGSLYAYANSKKYLIKGSVGQGNWATIPWICIFDKRITTSAMNGVYIVYLLSKDGKTLYLTLNQGCTDLKNKFGKTGAIKKMQSVAKKIRCGFDCSKFEHEGMTLGDNLPDLAQMYEAGCVCYKAYKQGDIPSNVELVTDLEQMLKLYDKYVENIQKPSRTWLLTWNPNNWAWDSYAQDAINSKNGIVVNDTWACNNTHVKIGDTVYLIMLGMGDKNGIIASGIATSENYMADHWDNDKAEQGIQSRHIDIQLNRLRNYNSESILKQNDLKSIFPDQEWSPIGSGIQIKEEYVEELSALWDKLFEKSNIPEYLDKEGEKEMTAKQTIEQIKAYIASEGFTYPDGMIENFYLSLKSKPFVLLAGTSGTGKTRLVKLFAESVGATKDNGRYKLVAVRPDWSDSSDLFGHVDLNGDFIEGAIIDFVRAAQENKEYPYFLCLDEMNLARVEYYFSDFLSIIETRDFKGNEIVTDPILESNYFGKDTAAAEKFGTIILPENLYIIGTVNMDETTFPFSKKVLDRANTIEFSYVDLIPNFEEVDHSEYSFNIKNDFFRAEYLRLAQCKDVDGIGSICTELDKINKILEKANAHIGYRVRDEIVFYMLSNDNMINNDDAFDNEIMQKILPRIQGSSASIKNMLCELFKVCASDFKGFQTDSDVGEEMIKTAEKPECKYKKSAKKIAFMVRRFEEDGFTSYWI